MFSLSESFPYEVPQIINIPITEAEVVCAISSLKNKTSCGYDGLEPAGSHFPKRGLALGGNPQARTLTK
jgi:hypothetical protein